MGGCLVFLNQRSRHAPAVTYRAPVRARPFANQRVALARSAADHGGRACAPVPRTGGAACVLGQASDLSAKFLAVLGAQIDVIGAPVEAERQGLGSFGFFWVGYVANQGH